VRKLNLGSASPLGSTITKKGVNFSFAAPGASQVEILLFAKGNDKTPIEIIALDKKFNSGDYWHVEIEGLIEGCCYSYRVTNDNASTLNNSKTDFSLIDPCAREISGWDLFNKASSKEKSPKNENYLKSVVSERNLFDFNAHPRPNHSWNQTVIYELHVGGFTQRSDSKVDHDKQGTFLGLIEKIPYLKDLGITSIELLPVFAFDPFDAPIGVSNYWGYSPINWFTPHSAYISSNQPSTARDQFRELVATCHDEGIEVLLDVVYNHTREGNKDGPIISWKGFGDSIYYHKDKKNNYLDVTGCGNTISANNPIARHLILESMRCWANELGVDGFRFDLGIALSRGEGLKPLERPPIFEEIEADPALSQIKLISEPWDCGGLYRLADFPAKKISTWNGRFRDDLRRFWKGDKNCAWDLKDRLLGSPNLYEKKEGSAKHSINFITSHDGFTLLDLVSFNSKHNLANGENNRDGDNHNNNWNHGLEGPCTCKKIQTLRKKQQRNLLSTLLLSPGIPMILMGDEVGRSQGGNNNTWCQNSPLGWMIWASNNCDNDLKMFVKKLVLIRKKLPELFSPKQFIKDSSLCKENDLCIQWHGIKLGEPDWGSWSHTISYSLNIANKGPIAWIGLNAYEQKMHFELPKTKSSWVKVFDTSIFNENNLSEQSALNQTKISLEDRSMVLMLTNEYSKRIKE
tara:strand:- start:54 stop:2117 length:2064 start_codon:yes stop_codon:yes gene_type:complete